MSVTECRTAVLADWHDGDDTNAVLRADGRSFVQLLFRVSSGVSSSVTDTIAICVPNHGISCICFFRYFVNFGPLVGF